MVTILAFFVILTLIFYPISCIVFLRTLDKEKYPERADEWINIFSYAYWSKKNIEQYSNDLWRPRFLFLRQKLIWYLIGLLLFAILTGALHSFT